MISPPLVLMYFASGILAFLLFAKHTRHAPVLGSFALASTLPQTPHGQLSPSYSVHSMMPTQPPYLKLQPVAPPLSPAFLTTLSFPVHDSPASPTHHRTDYFQACYMFYLFIMPNVSVSPHLNVIATRVWIYPNCLK